MFPGYQKTRAVFRLLKGVGPLPNHPSIAHTPACHGRITGAKKVHMPFRHEAKFSSLPPPIALAIKSEATSITDTHVATGLPARHVTLPGCASSTWPPLSLKNTKRQDCLADRRCSPACRLIVPAAYGCHAPSAALRGSRLRAARFAQGLMAAASGPQASQ